MILVKYNPVKEFYKSIVGAVPQDVKFGVRVQVNNCISPDKMFMCVYADDGFKTEFAMYQDRCEEGFCNFVADVSLKKGLYWYYFRMEGVQNEQYIGKTEQGNAGLFYDNVKSWQLSVYDKKYQTPRWLNNGVCYQIMVDRFNSVGKVVPTEDKIMRRWGEQPYYQEEDGRVTNRDFFGGTLKGVEKKLPYLRSLNVKTIYLNPIFTAYSNHKYDTEDYENIDSMFGTNEDFVSLCHAADKLGISIILDGVFNHVGSSSKYFNKEGKYGKGGAYNDKKSPYRSWFNFDENNNYECWWNFETLPRINAENKQAQQYFCGENGIVPMWLKRGAAGWRLDVVDEIADCMLDKIVQSAKKQDPQCAIIGEVWEDASNKTDYGVRRRYFEGAQLDSVMNYPLQKAIIAFVRDGNVWQLHETAFNILNNYPLHVRNNLMNILGTHDTLRILTELAGDRVGNSSKHVMSKTKLSDSQYNRGIELLKLAVVLQYTFFGFPCVYYGDEAGMEGYRDPFCRGCYPWGKENKLLRDFYTEMGQLRNMNVFCNGDFDEMVARDGFYAFQRSSNDSGEKVVVAVNRGSCENTVLLDGMYRDLLTGRLYSNSATVVPDSFVILEKVYSE